ncbi:branched-chain amino acid ABC transporter permease [Bradyrhizobium sp. CCGB12]|uniref:branched-chain amino acid ABC transporter permease n=1 Tax=Bradyrhizobium sp. CCGB12 TaxID=2949632 RepID=UPI0020B1B6F6|nr:branched-chain amino acid ABC transporter permease [Bradyrhizobium sp. CCGB12]MCP3387766.1 branched-chain amino acid ABC transporter permease [Bradyrhizobium sp. CCGB12]
MILDRATVFKLIFGLLLFAATASLSAVLDNYYLQVGTTLAMLCVLCWAWNLVGGYMGYPALSMISFFGVGAYADGIAQMQGLSIYAAWIAAALIGAIVALLLGLPLLRLKGHYFAVGTVASVEVLREVANNWDSLTGGAIGMNIPIQPGNPDLVGRFFFLSMLGLALGAFLITVVVDRSRFGFGLRCIRQNEQAASMVGINVFAYKVAAFVLSGAIGAAAGGIYASMVAFIEPKDAFNLIMTIEVPVMVMLGGMGTIFGPLIGGVFYVVLKEFVWAYFIDWHSGILGLIIVAVIYFLPAGVLGLSWKSMFNRWARSHRTNLSAKTIVRQVS